MPISKFFPTQIYSDRLTSPALRNQLLREVKDLSELDNAGREWSKKNYPNGFTSFASANELHKTSSTFHRLEQWIDSRVAKFARHLELDLGSAQLRMTTCWANVMGKNSHHGMHLHPLSIVSGTFYLSLPSGSPAIKFEDPRLSSFMNAPPRGGSKKSENRTHVEFPCKPGSVVLFESWLRHEVPLHTGASPRISVSFNYEWD